MDGSEEEGRKQRKPPLPWRGVTLEFSQSHCADSVVDDVVFAFQEA